MEKVTGIGGIFFKTKEPKVLGQWYAEHLGIDVQDWGGAHFPWRDAGDPERAGSTVWSLFPADTKYLDPSTAPFMVNYRVADLDAMLAQLRAGGVDVDEKVDESEYGKFGWAMDPDGNRFELWQPPAGM
ncbi:MAG TPA: VOC family protein [Longimicrobium sp.]|jgi:catechol 2,3-dioxygenase-like lactoylglutathione lyase family enzyme|nr:VOC family protein [Longimicrobium sp.]